MSGVPSILMAGSTGATLPPPFFHQDSETVRFWVQVPGGASIGAILTKQLLHYRFDAKPDGSDAVALYEKHRSDIDASVLRRVAGGSIEPVMLREHDGVDRVVIQEPTEEQAERTPSWRGSERTS